MYVGSSQINADSMFDKAYEKQKKQMFSPKAPLTNNMVGNSMDKTRTPLRRPSERLWSSQKLFQQPSQI